VTEALVQYNRPLIPPGAVCVACDATEMLVRDHCHEHGWVRGIVCRSCNTRLGVIDRGYVPRGDEDLLAALLAVRNHCPDCKQIDITSLVRTGRELVRPSAEGAEALSLRLDAAIRDRVDAYARKTRRSRNATVNQLLEIALDHVEQEAGSNPP
jgi:hypothetical protein